MAAQMEQIEPDGTPSPEPARWSTDLPSVADMNWFEFLKALAKAPPGELPKDLLELTKCQAITIRDEAWRADVDRLMDAIGRPYRWDLLVIRILIAVIVTPLAVWMLAPQLAPDHVSDYGFLRGLVLSLVGFYGLIEFFLGYRYFRGLNRLRQTAQR